MKMIIFISLLLVSHVVIADPLLKIAVIDTGFSRNDYNKNVKICDNKGIDFTGTHIKDNHGHGTNVASLIANQAGNVNYCLMILKYTDPDAITDPVYTTEAAINYAIDHGANVINYSSGGEFNTETDKKVFQKALDKKIVFFVSAGNNKENLDKKCDFFPACYDPRLIVVGNGPTQERKDYTSNYGKVVDIWIDGNDQDAGGQILSGTSQSTAIACGRFIKFIFNRKLQSDTSEAVKKAGEAFYIQSGIKNNINYKIQNVEEKIPETAETIKVITPIINMFIEQKVQYKWVF